MKRHQFTTIAEVRQAQLLLKKSVKVSERQEGFLLVELFQMENGYMEVFRHEHFNVTIKAVHFTELCFLDPYLENINIEALLISQ
jgi:hypothetical protein